MSTTMGAFLDVLHFIGKYDPDLNISKCFYNGISSFNAFIYREYAYIHAKYANIILKGLFLGWQIKAGIVDGDLAAEATVERDL